MYRCEDKQYQNLHSRQEGLQKCALLYPPPIQKNGIALAIKFWLICERIVLQFFNPGPAEPRYALPLQTVWIQISWLLQKPTDLDLHCLFFSMWNLYQQYESDWVTIKNRRGIFIYSAWQGLISELSCNSLSTCGKYYGVRCACDVTL